MITASRQDSGLTVGPITPSNNYLLDIPSCTAYAAFGGKADMTICDMSAFAVAIACKADMACCTAYVCF